MTQFIPTDLSILRRCLASVLRAADLIEDGEPTLAVETLHCVATDLEHLLDTTETRVPGFPGHEALADIRHGKVYHPPTC